MSGCGARTAAGSLKAVFEVVGCGAFRLGFDGGGPSYFQSTFSPAAEYYPASIAALFMSANAPRFDAVAANAIVGLH